MTTYRARMMAHEGGAENSYDFEERPDLMSRMADEIVEAFMEHANRRIFGAEPVRYELNGVVKFPDKNVVVGMGRIAREGDKASESEPFTIIINPAKMG